MNNIDKSLKERLLILRRYVLEHLNKLENKKKCSLDDIESLADLLSNYGEYVIPIIIKKMESHEESYLLSRYEYLIKYMHAPEFVQYLLNVDNNSNVTLRRTIFNLLDFFNIPHSESPMFKYMKNEKDLLINILTGLKDEVKVEETLFKVKNFVKHFYFLDEHGQLDVIKNLDYCYKKEAFYIFEGLLHSGSKKIIKEVIRILGRIRHAEGLRLLKDAALYLPKSFSEDIERSVRKLNFAGILSSQEKQYVDNIIKTGITNLNKDDIFLLSLEIIENGVLKKYLVYINEIGLLEQVSEIDTMKNNSFAKEELFEIDKKFFFKILSDVIYNHYLTNVEFPWKFVYLSMFIKPALLHPEKYTCSYYHKDLIYIPYNKAIDDVLKENNWLLNDNRFIDFVEKWYSGTEPYEDLWREHLFIRKVLREIVLSEFDLWIKRLCQMGDFFYYTGKNRELAYFIHNLEKRMQKNVELLEKENFLKNMIIYNKNKVLQHIGRG